MTDNENEKVAVWQDSRTRQVLTGTLYRVLCPTCATDENLMSVEVLTGYAETNGVWRTKADGVIYEATDWTGHTAVDWDSQERADVPERWFCSDCVGYWRDDQLVEARHFVEKEEA